MKTDPKASDIVRRISDLQLATTVRVLGYPLVGVEGPPHRRIFLFQVPEEVVLAYYSDEIQVSPRKLFGAYRDLRGLAVQTL